ncbi:MAG: hypothetical protein DRJ38_05815, partial [Thermoprotei archaeon]
SAIYAWSFYIDLASVGCTSAVKRECLSIEERRKRAELAIDALALMLDTRIFGAKQTRFSPMIDYETVLVALSSPLPFNVSPPASGIIFVEDTVKRAKTFRKATESEVRLYAYARDGDIVKNLEASGVKVYPTLLEMFSEVKNDAMSMLR